MAAPSFLEMVAGAAADLANAATGKLRLFFDVADGLPKVKNDAGTVVSLKGTTGDTGPGYLATSTTSLAIGTGSKVFTTQAGLAYTAGARVRASSGAAPTVDYMEGVCSAYSGTTLTVTMDLTAGSGTHADWSLNIAGDRGTAGSSAIPTDTLWDAKGDLAVGTGADTAAKLTAGANGTMLVADSSATTGLKWAGPPACLVYHSTTQSVGSEAALLFDSEDYDPDGMHSTVSNTSRVTIPVSGVYHLRAFAFWGVTIGQCLLRFRKNGTTNIRGTNVYTSAAGSSSASVESSVNCLLAAGDYVEAMLTLASTQNVGHASAVEAQTVFSVYLVRAS